MKAYLAAALLAAAGALAAAPSAKAAPTTSFAPSAVALRGGVGIGVGIGVGRGGYYAPRPYWGITGYSTQWHTVIVGYDRYGRPLYGSRAVSVPVYGWIYPAPARYYRPYVRPSVGVGLGFRF